MAGGLTPGCVSNVQGFKTEHGGHRSVKVPMDLLRQQSGNRAFGTSPGDSEAIRKVRSGGVSLRGILRHRSINDSVQALGGALHLLFKIHWAGRQGAIESVRRGLAAERIGTRQQLAQYDRARVEVALRAWFLALE
jgi:hypothetical protein